MKNLFSSEDSYGILVNRVVFRKLKNIASAPFVRKNHNPDAIHIYSQKNPDDVYKYPCFCNTRNPMWVFLLINTFEYYLCEILNCTVFHGSCVKIKNKTILIIGERTSGKTTLTQYLVDNCCADYMGDDSVFLIDNIYYGFSLPILMRKVNENKKPLITTKDEEGSERYVYNLRNIITKAYQIDYIFFPKYDKLVDFQCDEIKDSGLFNALINNVKKSKDMRSIYDDINNLISTAQAYRIHYNNCRSVVMLINEKVI